MLSNVGDKLGDGGNGGVDEGGVEFVNEAGAKSYLSGTRLIDCKVVAGKRRDINVPLGGRWFQKWRLSPAISRSWRHVGVGAPPCHTYIFARERRAGRGDFK